ncbi:MAG: single-stranded DNA-binding protein [Spirochaetales bacterium]|uniref:Single-stranded DNA-binding protein n=1 Tax=Candidatus Thalassospirochaeta sargassi TaxID=3119039 RepID=A0AAJ1MII7_9SPIO|nr:single-stranded DNA-binding protein [Spirochaetales bacterium]
MNSVNSVIIEGNLVRDPVLTETPKGTKVCNFTVASNRYYKQDEEYQKEVTFLDVETWTRLAAYSESNFSKGKGIRIVGRLKQDRWEDREGNPRSRLKLVAEYVEKRPTFSKEALRSEEESESEESADMVESESSVEAESVI